MSKIPSNNEINISNNYKSEKQEVIPRFRQLYIFSIFTVLLSGPIEIIIIIRGSVTTDGGIWAIILMWCPGLSAIIVYFLFKPLKIDLGLMKWSWKDMGLGYLIPFIYSISSYLIIWLGSIGEFNSNYFNLSIIIYRATIGVVTSIFFALGEEIGWRGFLVTELNKKFTFIKMCLINGLIWAFWHYPLIIFADYRTSTTPLWFNLLCFTLMAIGGSFIMVWLRLRSQSVWPAAIYHASHNSFIQSIFDPLTIQGNLTGYFSGEFGVLIFLLEFILIGLLWKKFSTDIKLMTRENFKGNSL